MGIHTVIPLSALRVPFRVVVTPALPTRAAIAAPSYWRSVVGVVLLGMSGAAAAFTPSSEWFMQGQPPVFNTQGEASGYMQGLGSPYQYLTQKKLIYAGEYAIQYEYSAPLVSPVVTSDWSYSSPSLGGSWTTEAGLVAAENAALAAGPGCPRGHIVASGNWYTISWYWDPGQISRTEKRTYIQTAIQVEVQLPTPHCEPAPNQPWGEI